MRCDRCENAGIGRSALQCFRLREDIRRPLSQRQSVGTYCAEQYSPKLEGVDQNADDQQQRHQQQWRQKPGVVPAIEIRA